ncbi:hypothetical protein SGL43_03872 [Streptomyces globisporus]|uniref:Uncharacterized protein n=1 Tax=Streptomyces globisporus TaxID=1908 RepID=A0ABM9GZV3_STRGL|nr:hypothetical protein SGL43_03872 [Streptomyces globisporus]
MVRGGALFAHTLPGTGYVISPYPSADIRPVCDVRYDARQP